MSARKTRKTKNDQIGSDIVSRPKPRPKRMCTRIKAQQYTFGSLPDFCLLQIFNRLHIQNLCTMSDVNHQFKRVSKMSFTERRATWNLQNYLDGMRTDNDERRRVLCKFGDSIKSIQWDKREKPLVNLNEISRFCAGTMDELDVRTRTLECDDSLRPLFSSLKTLTLQFRSFTGDAGRLFSECQELKVLRLKLIPNSGSTDMSAVAQKYSKLEELVIGEGRWDWDVTAELDEDEVRTINLLLEMNLHIKKLDMFDDFANRTIYAFASKMDGLEVLVLRHKSGRNCYKNVTELAGLKSLKVLELHDDGPDFVAAIEAMQSVPIESFKWHCCPEDLQFLERIGKWKSLKSLALTGISLPLGGSLAELIEQLPLLHELELEFENQREQVRYIIKLLERFPKLDTLGIHPDDPELFDQEFYDALLEVILRRRSSGGSKSFKVSIYSYYHVKHLQMHRQLQMIFLRPGCDSLGHYVRFKRYVPQRSFDRWESPGRVRRCGRLVRGRGYFFMTDF